MAKNKHLTDSERLQIEECLKGRISLKKIASLLGKSTSTISREIRAHVLDSDKFARYRIRNRCINRRNCGKRYLCDDKPNCSKSCSGCNLCNELCKEFVEEICYKLYESPYCCNGCLDEYQCVLMKKYYIHKKAHEAYRELLTESRVGANITEDELLALDNFISPLLMRRQSVHHIVSNNPDQFNISERTIYRYVSGSLLRARNIDMPRVCRIRPRKTKPIEHKVDKTCRIGRTYADFTALIEQTNLSFVEMDSVIGRVGGKVLLTMMFNSCDFMLAFIRNRNTSRSVIDVYDDIYELIGKDSFRRLFPVCLCDNGSEFSNPAALELDSQGDCRTKIFYCDPHSAFQKPHVELNHQFIRKILPKGKSFDLLSQGDINLMMSHINSYTREKLNDKSPHDLFGFLYGFDTLDKLGCRKIPANDILLKPDLLK